MESVCTAPTQNISTLRNGPVKTCVLTVTIRKAQVHPTEPAPNVHLTVPFACRPPNVCNAKASTCPRLGFVVLHAHLVTTHTPKVLAGRAQRGVFPALIGIIVTRVFQVPTSRPIELVWLIAMMATTKMIQEQAKRKLEVFVHNVKRLAVSVSATMFALSAERRHTCLQLTICAAQHVEMAFTSVGLTKSATPVMSAQIVAGFARVPAHVLPAVKAIFSPQIRLVILNVQMASMRTVHCGLASHAQRAAESAPQG